MGSSWRRDPQSVTQVNLIRPNDPASLRVNGEAKFRENRKVGDLTSHGNGVRRREDMKTRWLRMECEIGVCAAPQGGRPCALGHTVMRKWGNLPLLKQKRHGARAVMVAQASRGNNRGGAPSTPERRRVTTAGAKDGRKENPWKS